MIIEIKNRFTGAVIHTGDYANIGEAVKAAMIAMADLSGANLSRANLFGANLSGAYLSGAYLSGAVDRWAQVAFMEHGECGRMLTAIKRPDCEPELFCGCFIGFIEQLREYIANGDEKLKASRTLAADTVMMLLNYTQEGGK